VQESTDELEVGDIDCAGHIVHTALPVELLYFPVAHSVHTPPSGPVNPTLHVHAGLVTSVFELSGQDVHAALPRVLLYFPATQDVQVPAVDPVNPALHKHASIVAPAGAENEFGGQSMHVHISLALSYLPALHSTHVRSAPPLQRVQSVPSFVHFPQQYVHQIDPLFKHVNVFELQ
jgi:hypothetical protein